MPVQTRGSKGRAASAASTPAGTDWSRIARSPVHYATVRRAPRGPAIRPDPRLQKPDVEGEFRHTITVS